jgi:hypothetical protein
MVAPLHTFLDGIARGPACDCMRTREGAAGPIQSITLLLRRGSNSPNETNYASICKALTSSLALIRGKPSGVRLAELHDDEDEEVMTSWRLPCVIEKG